MKLRTPVGIAAAAVMLASCQPASEGATGKKAEEGVEPLDEQPARIVATTVSATELADALNLELVGIPTSYKELPERYENVTEIGNPMSPDMEQIRSLDADVVWSVTTLEADLEEPFAQAGIDAKFLNFQSVEAMSEEILEMGEAYQREEQANRLVARFNERISELQKQTKDADSPSVLILMGVPGSYLVATEHSYIGDLVRLAGGENIVQGEDEAEYLASNTEYLQQANPDVILRAAHGMPEEVVEMFDEEFKTNDIWKHFNAVKNGRVYDLEELLFGTTGNIAVVEALDELEAMLYPEAGD
ncbi:cobalamin/Fe3+-siderophore ABC transporter substrate-binding protein [Niallia circulans]|uniref:heme ABC transporter substrate-binding protein IsdE n=1 Tax=Shouchella clausii TaxID=79880 RepID=UPI000799BD91|nr:heme ABC transporter substrate-binding protein IsdE [Shouchella clausii]SPU21475.1 cobalamin/Fe3+-siderophore ABC transporter substrate-binding protein [Niallia circulans]KKI84757.1 heme ABC transporter substrate-binding protein [Shouchella clausii]MCM3550524.1 heme ABC transporter substrate-binding protein IsdE [Shouchella clausii]MDO7266402.1 heme ABC transporter substrate-binding protein IsdE [Shouchella clausii]MDO7286683.1 heme ABC transporter substrate-binding protein IsdE [Shouchella